MLHDELGVEITAEEVAEQNPDLIADTLDDYSQGVYEIRKEEITEEYEIRPKAIVFMESGPGFASMTQHMKSRLPAIRYGVIYRQMSE